MDTSLVDWRSNVSKSKRLLKPATVLKQWEALVKKMKKKRPGRKVAREYAAKCGMKSIGEVRCAADLDKRKIRWKYEHEVLEYQHEPQSYTPDFTLIDLNNLLIEYKGKMINDTRKKILAIKRCNPKRRICLVFERANNKLSSRPNSLRYWQWSERHGIAWSETYVRDEWFKPEFWRAFDAENKK
jgi:hypothetical protein